MEINTPKWNLTLCKGNYYSIRIRKGYYYSIKDIILQKGLYLHKTHPSVILHMKIPTETHPNVILFENTYNNSP